MAVVEIKSYDEFKNLVENNNENILIINFWASWAKPCKSLNNTFKELSKNYGSDSLKFIQIEAEEYPEIAKSYDVTSVPYFVFVKNNSCIDVVKGADQKEIVSKIIKYHEIFAPETQKIEQYTKSNNINERIQELLKINKIMIFMKGTPSQPKCGFSRKLVDILNNKNLNFKHFDILLDEEIRQGLKKYSNWPTYPQLYINGELVGGLDVVQEYINNGEFDSMIPEDAYLN